MADTKFFQSHTGRVHTNQRCGTGQSVRAAEITMEAAVQLVGKKSSLACTKCGTLDALLSLDPTPTAKLTSATYEELAARQIAERDAYLAKLHASR